MSLFKHGANVFKVLLVQNTGVFLERTWLGIFVTSVYCKVIFATDENVVHLGILCLPVTDCLDQQVLCRIEIITGLAKSPVMFKEDMLGLEISIKPAHDHIQVFSDKGIVAFLFSKCRGTGPGSTMIVPVVHSCSPRQGAKPHKAMR